MDLGLTSPTTAFTAHLLESEPPARRSPTHPSNTGREAEQCGDQVSQYKEPRQPRRRGRCVAMTVQGAAVHRRPPNLVSKESCYPADVDAAGHDALSTRAREDRLCQRWNEQDSHAERGDHGERLNAIDPILRRRDHRRQRGHEAEYELFEHHEERDRDHWFERVLQERPQPPPEQPVEL